MKEILREFLSIAHASFWVEFTAYEGEMMKTQAR